eukprot:5076034-Prymnesium_polylepis.1
MCIRDSRRPFSPCGLTRRRWARVGPLPPTPDTHVAPPRTHAWHRHHTQSAARRTSRRRASPATTTRSMPSRLATAC